MTFAHTRKPVFKATRLGTPRGAVTEKRYADGVGQRRDDGWDTNVLINDGNFQQPPSPIGLLLVAVEPLFM